MRISDWSSDVCSSDLVMLIFSQAPDASQVAGFRKWQELGRQVRKGEKSIKIFGYSTKKITETDTETGEETTRRAARFPRSEEHKSELQSLMRNPYAVFCLNTKNQTEKNKT